MCAFAYVYAHVYVRVCLCMFAYNLAKFEPRTSGCEYDVIINYCSISFIRVFNVLTSAVCDIELTAFL